MSCHFQVSIEENPQATAEQPGWGAFKVRLRKDGHQWQPHPVEVDAQTPLGYVVSIQEDVEQIQRFPLQGPIGLPREQPLAILGWCMAHCPAFVEELNRATSQDRISIHGVEIDMRHPKDVFRLAAQTVAPIEQQLELDASTPDAVQPNPRPRL